MTFQQVEFVIALLRWVHLEKWKYEYQSAHLSEFLEYVLM